MHEMSIALSIVDIAKQYANKEKAQKVMEVELEIGTLAGIEFESLEFAIESVKLNSILEKAEIKINKIIARSKCLDCDFEFEVLNLFDACPNCKDYKTQLICGKEMQVKSLLLE